MGSSGSGDSVVGVEVRIERAVRAEARTYLRSKGEMRGFFPFGCAQGQNDKRKAEADSSASLRNDKQKGADCGATREKMRGFFAALRMTTWRGRDDNLGGSVVQAGRAPPARRAGGRAR